MSKRENYSISMLGLCAAIVNTHAVIRQKRSSGVGVHEQILL
jgi:hypothetical protein